MDAEGTGGASGPSLLAMGRPRSPRGRAGETVRRLAQEYPGSERELCALAHDGPFQLLVATILSAQTTDERVNSVTPALFAAWPTAPELAGADPEEVEAVIRPTGFFRTKARSLVAMAAALEERHGGRVPSDLEELVALPGVGRKTANVLRSVGFGLPGLPVDTHVGRLARRLGLTVENDPVKAEHELNRLVPAGERGRLSLRLILHGRRVCQARRPRCEHCVLNDFCPSSTVKPATGRSGRERRQSREPREPREPREQGLPGGRSSGRGAGFPPPGPAGGPPGSAARAAR